MRRARLVLLALVAGAAAILVWMAGGGPPQPWDYPELAPPVRDAEAHEIPEPLAGQEAAPIELLLDPIAALDLRARPAGSALRLESRSGERPVEATLRALAGPSAPRLDRVLGVASLDGLLPGAHWLELEAGQRTAVRLVRLPRQEPLVVDWGRLVTLTGHVFDTGGRPLEGAEVWVDGQTARTAKGGDFSFASVVAGEDVPVRVAAQGHAAYLEIVRVEPARSLRFVLEPGRRVAGTVHLPAGERALARVFALPVSTVGGHGFPWFWPGRYCDVPVDAEGRFAFEGLPRQTAVAISVLHPRYVHDEPVRVMPVASARAPVARLGIVLRAAPIASGRVAGAGGQGLAQASLVARPAGGSTWGETWLPGTLALAPQVRALGGCSAACDASGAFCLGLPWPRTEISAAAEGHVGERRVVAGRPTTLDLELAARPAEPAGGRATLVVRLAAPPPGALPGVWLVQVRWAGRPHGPAFRHDARQPLVVELGQPVLVDVGLRRPGGRSVTRHAGLRVTGRTEIDLVVPGT